jgi:ribosomal protein S18 acetylase RimI-like enzyme
MIRYSTTDPVSVEVFVDVLKRSTLGERRPIDKPASMAAMVEKADVFATAWDGELLVGVARCLTDFAYCCYLSDLAVDVSYQHQGIGKQLVSTVQSVLGEHCKLILLAAPAAFDYYPKIGFTQHPSAWVLG